MEKQKRTPLELQKIHHASKLYKPFISTSHRTLESEKIRKNDYSQNNQAEKAPLQDSLYMFGGVNDKSMQSIVYQNVEDLNTTGDDITKEEVFIKDDKLWETKKSTEEALKDGMN